MRGFGLWVLFLVIGTALICFCLSPVPDIDLAHNKKTMGLTKPSRKLKAEMDYKDEESSVTLNDYRPNDPVPSSKASIRPGPIQHGTPLMPYIPKPSPPGPNDPKYADIDLAHNKKTMGLTKPSRKLKAEMDYKDEESSVTLNDYRPNDPVPSSKASIRPGPIQHGTPLMPYIPKPSPPGPNDPKYAGFP